MSFVIPQWLSRRLHTLKRNGVLTLIKEKNVDLISLQLKDMQPYLQFIKTLDLTSTPIKSLKNLPKLPRITSFIADNSELNSCINFSSISSVTSISIKKTPLSQLPHYKLAILLAVGPNIVKIDGKMISTLLLNRYKTYPSFVHDLVDKGWTVQFPCPDLEELQNVSQKYEIQIPPHEEEDEDELTEVIISEPSQKSKEEVQIDFEKLAQGLWNQHEEMLQKKQAMFGIINDDLSEVSEDEADFAERLAALFKSHGIDINKSDGNALLEAIDILCRRKEKNNPTEFSE